jgi:hypothetical protein
MRTRPGILRTLLFPPGRPSDTTARLIAGPDVEVTQATAGIKPEQVAYWTSVLEAATQQPVWREELSRLNRSPSGRGIHAKRHTRRCMALHNEFGGHDA